MTGSDAREGEGGKTMEYEVMEPAASEPPAGWGVHAVDAGQSAPTEAPPPAPRALLFVVLGIAAMIGLIGLVAVRAKSAAGPAPFQDLGAGISNATGLKGDLKARWQKKAAQYLLKIEPIDPLQSAGFSYVVANPPGPLFIHVKLLDATGFAVCGKDILFPLDPASPGEHDRERGQDLFQSSRGDDGRVVAVNAQGTLPCTAEQYKQVVYWDLSTNFPTLSEQDELMKQTAQLKARQAAQKRAALLRQKVQRSAFYTEGDDRANGYDAPRKLLQTGLGRSFLVSGSAAQATASAWAASGALFHYRCDQRSRCVLTHAGGTDSLSVFALQ